MALEELEGIEGNKRLTWYSTVQLKLVVKTKFPFIFPTSFTQIPQMGIFVKQFSLIFPLFPRSISPISLDFPIIPTDSP